MKRRKRSEETKTLQNATQKLAEPKGLAFTKAEVPMKRRGTGLMFASTKAREELALKTARPRCSVPGRLGSHAES
jgi:hypothetical protein